MSIPSRGNSGQLAFNLIFVLFQLLKAHAAAECKIQPKFDVSCLNYSSCPVRYPKSKLFCISLKNINVISHKASKLANMFVCNDVNQKG